MTRPQLSIGQRGCEGINTYIIPGIYKSQSYVKLFSEAFACSHQVFG